jgi:hypothetical protein
VRLARDIARRRGLDPFRGRETAPGPDCRTDAEIDAFVRRTAITVHHPCGTCAMGTGEDTVLDPALRVRGVERLRVADASAMPDLVSGNINARVLMIAETSPPYSWPSWGTRPSWRPWSSRPIPRSIGPASFWARRAERQRDGPAWRANLAKARGRLSHGA